VLLPAWLLARRCDGTAVIGNMLTRAARALGVPEDGGRDGGAGGYAAGPAAPVPLVGGRVREVFTRLAGVLSPDPVPLNRAGSPVGDAVVAVAAAVAAARGRWPALTVSGWELAAAVTAGSLLCPSVCFAHVRGDAVPSVLA
jgi:hypothetical protein